jgi:protein-tyrosine phosphatase
MSKNWAPPPWIRGITGYASGQWRRYFGLNISQVDPLLFVGGQFHPQQWKQIHALGVRAVLSLQAERADAFTTPEPEQALRLMVPDFQAPSLAQLAEGVAFIEAAHAVGLPVFVHCHAGVGRAPLMAAAYLVARRAMTVPGALGTIRSARPIIRPNRLQRARLAEFAVIYGNDTKQ